MFLHGPLPCSHLPPSPSARTAGLHNLEVFPVLCSHCWEGFLPATFLDAILSLLLYRLGHAGLQDGGLPVGCCFETRMASSKCIEAHASSSAKVNLAPGAFESDSRAVQQSCAQEKVKWSGVWVLDLDDLELEVELQV